MTHNRTYERLLTGIHAGTVRLNTNNYRYRHAQNHVPVDNLVFDAEDHGWVHLTPGKQPTVTGKGMQWLANRYAKYGIGPTRPEFMLPALPPATRAPAPAPAARPPAAPPKPPPTAFQRGEKHPKARLTDQQVRDIRTRLAAGMPSNMLAAEYGVAQSTIRDVKKGITWTHVTLEKAA